MRFRFCGDLDAPDWLLSEISVLAKITSVRIKLLAVQVINRLAGQEFVFEKVQRIVKDALPGTSDLKAAIAALHFILHNAAKYDVDAATLSTELQQLGLPRENSDALVRPFVQRRDEIRTHLSATSFALPRVTSVDWRVDCVVASSALQEVLAPAASLRLQLRDSPHGEARPLVFHVSPDKLRALHLELVAARRVLQAAE